MGGINVYCSNVRLNVTSFTHRLPNDTKQVLSETCDLVWDPTAAQRRLQVVGGDEAVAVADSALVDHGAVVRHLDGLADAGLAALHYAQLVRRVVCAQVR